MPVLSSKERKTTRIELPEPEGTEVEVYEELTFGEAMEVMNTEEEVNRGMVSVRLLIKDWNLEDENGKKLPVNDSSIKLLPASSAKALADYASGLLREGKDKKK